MKKERILFWAFGYILIALLSSSCNTDTAIDAADRDRIFNEHWKFVQGQPEGAEQPEFDDSGWATVDLPHDWSLVDLPGEDTPQQIGPFSVESPGGGLTAYVLGGTGWYRKHFTLDRNDEGKSVVLHFDGIYMNSEIWVNGNKLGTHPYGYTAFWFDITPHLNNPGEENVVAVRVDNLGHNARWYSGSGIYRNVHLVVTDPVHIAVDGVYISTPRISENEADISLEATILNDTDQETEIEVRVNIIGPDGVHAGTWQGDIGLAQKGTTKFNTTISVSEPVRWSLSSPNLYKAEVLIREGNQLRDAYLEEFGIRTIEISVEEGFTLNGEPIILKGGCMHHDNGLLGAAAFDRAEERRVEIMKANGFNAIRCSHNPPSEAFLDACDRLGMLVIDEIFDVWEQPKFMPQGAHLFFKEWWKKDVESWIVKDRNHPSVIMWSIGNEIVEAARPSGLEIARDLIGHVRSLDPSRHVTEAMQDMEGLFSGKSGWYQQEEHKALLDVVGYNYKDTYYEKDHELYPDRIICGSETFSLFSFEYWQLTEKHPYIIGDFVWTGMDYLGESGVGNTQYVPEGTPEPPGLEDLVNSGVPFDLEDLAASFGGRADTLPAIFVAWCGDIDITGEKKPQMYFKDILWDNSPLEMLVHEPIPEGMIERTSNWGWPYEYPSWNWNGNEGDPLQVRVFTKGDRVILELNGELIGEKEVSVDSRYTAEFMVPYQPGELKATAYENGQEIATRILRTTGDVAGIRLIADRNEVHPDRNDLAFVKVEAVDRDGQVVTDGSVSVKLTVSGNGELAASGNADPEDMESVNRPVIKTYNGKAQAIIRPFAETGTIILKAESEGLDTGEVMIEVR